MGDAARREQHAGGIFFDDGMFGVLGVLVNRRRFRLGALAFQIDERDMVDDAEIDARPQIVGVDFAETIGHRRAPQDRQRGDRDRGRARPRPAAEECASGSASAEEALHGVTNASAHSIAANAAVS